MPGSRLRLMRLLILLLLLTACGKRESSERCQSADEAQMRCQIEYAELYQAFEIPAWVKQQCKSYYPTPGCYFESGKRERW